MNAVMAKRGLQSYYASVESKLNPIGDHMLVVHVSVEVKEDCISEFIEATLDNAAHSVQEPGIARFDVVQDREKPSLFTLVEAYYSEEDPARHKETDHYKRWRDRVESMMASPRTSTKHNNLFPEDSAW